MIGIVELCKVCGKEVMYIGPHIVGRDNCICEKFDVNDGPDGRRFGIVHIFEGHLYFNKFSGDMRIVDGTITKMNATDLNSKEANEEIGKILSPTDFQI